MKEISAVLNVLLQAFKGISWEFGELENPIVRNLKLVEYIEGMKIDPELKDGSIYLVEPILGSSNLSGLTLLLPK